MCIVILLILARTKSLLCFQEAWEFADRWRFWKVKKQNHLMSPTVLPQLIILNIFCNLLLFCSYLHHLMAGINISLMSWKLMSFIFSLLCRLICCLWLTILTFLHRLLLTICNFHLWQFHKCLFSYIYKWLAHQSHSRSSSAHGTTVRASPR